MGRVYMCTVLKLQAWSVGAVQVMYGNYVGLQKE